MRLFPAAVAILAAAVTFACGGGQEKPDEVASKDTFECTLEGERWLVRFVDQEARLLTPQGERINLYQIASGSGVRFTNGLIELRGRGTQLTLIRDNFARDMLGCKPVMVPKESANPMLRLQPAPAPLGK